LRGDDVMGREFDDRKKTGSKNPEKNSASRTGVREAREDCNVFDGSSAITAEREAVRFLEG
jgi:hypothetical protein